MWAVLEAPASRGPAKFAQSRAREGENLKNDLIAKLDALDEKVSRVEARSPEVVDSYREKLEAKVHELLEDSQIEDSLLQQKLSCSPIRSATMRETVRLHSHIQGMKKMLEEKEGIGRKLDFYGTGDEP